MLLAAPDHSITDVQTLPWWAQLLIGLGLIAASVIGHQIDKKIDSGFLEIVTFLLGCGGLYLTFTAIF